MQKKQLILILQTLLALALTQGVVLLAMRAMQGSAHALTLPAHSVTARQFLLTFLLSTALILFLVRTFRQKFIFEVIFMLSLFSGIWFLAGLVLPSVAVLVAAGLVVLRYLFPYVAVQNFLIMVGIAGIATALGSATNWHTGLVIILVLAIYDVVAVYGTGHMVTMFKGLLERGVVFALIVPERPRLLFKRLRDVAHGEGFFFLGTGDLVLPSFFAASAAREGFPLAVGAAVGSLFGLFFTDLLFSWGRKRPMPALPPISLGTLLGFFFAMGVSAVVY